MDTFIKEDMHLFTFSCMPPTCRYKQVLSRHSSSVKVLQLYVKFLQSVRGDPWGAAK
jgi:hypothetical protein